MEITVSSRNTEVSEGLRAAAIEKVGRLARFVEGMDRAEVLFFQERNRRIPDKEVCEVVLEGHGHHVRAKVSAEDPLVAVDKAVAKLEHQLHKLKTRLQRRSQGKAKGRDAGVADDLATVAVPAADDDAGPRIVKAKRHTLKPMSPDEAALQLDLLGHDFYFFTNADTGRGAVVYRRADGDLGLIDEAD